MTSPDLESGSPQFEHHKASSSSSTDSTLSAGESTNSSSTYTEDVTAEPEPEALPRIVHQPHSSTPPRRGARRAQAPSSSRLGAIDEHSPSIAPDIPTRSPNRPKKVVAFLPNGATAKQLFSFSTYSRPDKDDADLPPPGAYDKIIGPRGEKFADLRQNRPFRPRGRGGLKKMLCIALVLIILAIALGVGLGVGLTRKNRNSNENLEIDPSSSNDNDDQPFPIGTYSIPTYLTDAEADCTSNSATWRCYPYTTYSDSKTSSFSTLQWAITSPSNSTLDLQISNTNPTFSYPFSNVPLTYSDAGDVRLSAFTFEFTFRKQVVPDSDITGDNSATRCYYNNTNVAVRLYSSAQGGGGQIVSAPAGQTTQGDAWPYAIEYEETIGEGPECFLYANGQEGAQVDVAAGSGTCQCAYRNYGLS